jgi:hypothetical protein
MSKSSSGSSLEVEIARVAECDRTAFCRYLECSMQDRKSKVGMFLSFSVSDVCRLSVLQSWPTCVQTVSFTILAAVMW